MIYLIPAILLLASLGTLAFIAIKKFPALVIIDVATIAKEREARLKHAILLEHASRIEKSIIRELKLLLRPVGALLKRLIHRGYARALELERRYRHAAVGTIHHRLLPTSPKKMMEEAERAERRGATEEAEHLMIEVIKADPKNAKAYEKLGRLYQRNRQYKEAAESFDFALKLNPQDASAHANVGELTLAQGDLETALKEFQAAVAIKPANPRYLNFLLEAALAKGDRDLARGAFVRLKAVNPENQRLAELEGKIKDL